MAGSPEEIRKKAIPLLRAVLAPKAKVGIPVHLLCREFEETVMEPLRFKDMGYGSLEQFLRDIPELCTVQRDSTGILVVKGIPSAEDAHIYRLVGGQKKKQRKRKSIPKKFHGNQVRRKASFFTGGAKPRVNKPQTPLPFRQPSYVYVHSPSQASQTFFQNPTANRQMFSTLRQTPSRSVPYFSQPVNVNPSRTVSFKTSSDIRVTTSNERPAQYETPPRFKKQQLQQEERPGNSTKPISNNENPNKEVFVTKEDLVILESQMRQLLKRRPNGLFATRLRPEFKSLFSHDVRDDIKDIIQKHFSHFVQISSHINGIEILYLTEDKIDLTAGNIKPNDQSDLMPRKENVAGSVNVGQKNENNKIFTSAQTYELRKDTNSGSTAPMPDKKLPMATSSNEIMTNVNNQHALSRPKPIFNIESGIRIDQGCEFKVFVCYVQTLDRFFVHYSDSQIDDLVNKMQLFYDSADGKKMILPEPKLGELCSARFSEDKLWFRAKILSVKKQTNVINKSYRCQVFFIDYGNDEFVVSSELRMLKEDYCKLPRQGIQCAMDDLIPIDGYEWPDKVVQKFITMTKNVELTMKVKQRNDEILCIDLVDHMGRSVKEHLIQKNLAKKKDPLPSESSSISSMSPASSVTDMSESSRTDLLLRSLSTEPADLSQVYIPTWQEFPIEEEFFDVSVCHVNTTADIFVNLVGDNFDEKLAKLENIMNKYYEESNLDNETLRIGGFYSCLVDDNYYRVKLLSVDNGDYHILLLDHGEKRIVAVQDFKTLPSKFLKLPFQAIQCSLANVPVNYDPEILMYLTESTLGKPRVAGVIERNYPATSKYVIEIYDTTTEIDININEEIKEMIDKEKNLEPPLPEIGAQCQVYVPYISPEGIFSIQILSAGLERLEILMEDMKSHFTAKKSRAAEFISHPEVGQLCCANHSEDGTWYRAKIKEVLPDRKVCAEFVDYGFSEIIPFNLIRKTDAVHDKVKTLPYQAVKCKLADLDMRDWNAKLHKTMTEITCTADTLYAEFVDPGSKTSYPLITITIMNQNENGSPSKDQTFNLTDLCHELENSYTESHEKVEKDMESLQDQLNQMNKNKQLQNKAYNSVSIDHSINDTSFDNKSLSSIDRSDCGRASLSSNISNGNVSPNSNHLQSGMCRNDSPSDSMNTTYENISLHTQNESLLNRPKGNNQTYSEWDIIPSDDSINASHNEHDRMNMSNHLLNTEVINANLSTPLLDKNDNNAFGNKILLSSPSTLEADGKSSSDNLSSTLEEENWTRLLNAPVLYKESWKIPKQKLRSRSFDAMVTSITSPSLLCFLECEMWESLELMHVHMMNFYDKSPPPVTLPLQSGDICAVYHESHEVWYRAVILTYIVDDGQAVVKFLDFSSDVEQVSGLHLRVLDESFRKLPFLSYRAALVGIKPTAGMKSWNEEVCKRLQDLSVNESFTVTVMGVAKDKLMVRMIGELPNKRKYSLSDRLIQEGLADPIINS